MLNLNIVQFNNMEDFKDVTPIHHPKTLLLIGGAVVMALAIIIAAVFVVRSRSQQVQVQELVTQVESLVEGCDMSDDPDACRFTIAEEQAGRIGAVEICEVLEGEAYDDCVWTTARSWMQEDFCKDIVDKDTEVRCWNEVVQMIARETADRSYCEKLKGDVYEASCLAYLTAGEVTTENCESYYDAMTCADLSVTERAVAARNPDLCEEIVDENAYEECVDSVRVTDRDLDGLEEVYEIELGTSDLSSDSDGDGLSDFQEVKEFGTDPLDEDTDGDGYLDGEEVKGGYNPLGEGLL